MKVKVMVATNPAVRGIREVFPNLEPYMERDALESITERYTRQFAIDDSWVRDEVKRIVSADADTLFSYSVKAGHCYSVPLMKVSSMVHDIGIKDDTARRDDARFYKDQRRC